MSVASTSDFSDILAKRIATGFFISGSEDEVSGEEMYDAIIDAPADTPFQVVLCEAFETESNEWAKHHIEDLAKASLMTLELYAAAVKKGLILAAIDCTLDGDANQWCMDRFATIGYNVSCEWGIDGATYTFDLLACKWKSESRSGELPYDPENGLPIHPLHPAT